MDHYPDRDLPGELFENTDYYQPFQCSPTACVACYFMTHSQDSHNVRPVSARFVSAHSIGLTGSEHVCEVCQKLTCLPIDQPAPVGKELSMTELLSANVPTNSSGQANGQSHGQLEPVNRDPGQGVSVNQAPDNTDFTGARASVAHLASPPAELPSLLTNLRASESVWMQPQLFMPYAAQQVTTNRQQPVPQQSVPQQSVPQQPGTVRRHHFEVGQLEKGLREHQLRERPNDSSIRRFTAQYNRRVARPMARGAVPEPATKASTYIVPSRSQSVFLDTMASSIPFAVLLVLFAIGLSAAVALASPSVALWIGVSELIITLLRALFVTVVFSTAIAFVLELSH